MRNVTTVLIALLLAPTFGGCRETRQPTDAPEATPRSREPIEPAPQSIAEIRGRTLARIAELEKDIGDGRVDPAGARRLVVSLNYLIGHMKVTGVGTLDQQRRLDGASAALSRSGSARAMPPRDWRPDGTAPPKITVDAAPLTDLLPRIRKLVESVPDSEKKPDWEARD